MATGASAVGKSPEAFRTISEVAAQLETPAHVLRFWESKFPQIKPVKRAGGRRYYRPDDIALLAGIKVLLHEQGITIRGVQKLLRERGARHVATLSALPWEGTEPTEEGLPPEEVAVDEVAAEEPEEEQAPEAVIVGPWPGAAVQEAQAEAGIVESFVAGTMARMAAGAAQPRSAGSAFDGIGRLRAALVEVDHARLRAEAGRLAPLVDRLRALRDRDAARRS